MIRIDASLQRAGRVFEDVVQTNQFGVGGDEKFCAFGESGRDGERIGGADASVLKFKIAALGGYDETRKVD